MVKFFSKLENWVEDYFSNHSEGENKFIFWSKEITIAILAMTGIFIAFPLLIALLLGVFFKI